MHQYDSLHRLTQTQRDDGTVIQYNYDELGNRKRKIVIPPPGVGSPTWTATATLTPVSASATATGTATGSPGVITPVTPSPGVPSPTQTGTPAPPCASYGVIDVIGGVSHPTWLGVEGGKLYVSSSGRVHVIDLASRTLITSIALAAHPQADAKKIAFASGKAYVALANLGSNARVAVIDTASDTVTKYIAVGGGDAWDIDVHNGLLYVTHPFTVDILDPAFDAVTATIANAGSGVQGLNDLAIVGALARGYVVDPGTSSLRQLNLTNSTATDPLALPIVPRAAVFGGGSVYVAGSPSGGDSGQIVAIAPASNSVGAPLSIGRNPTGLAVLGSRLFATSQNPVPDGTLAVIDTELGSILQTVTMGDRPTGVAVDPHTGTVYVANQADDTVFVVGCGEPTVTPTTTRTPTATRTATWTPTATPSFAPCLALAFGPSLPLDSSAVFDATIDSDPVVAAADEGTWLAAWRSEGPLGGILSARSADDGASWGPVTPITVPSNVDQKPRIDTDGAGNVVLVWYIAATSARVWSASSADSGGTWTRTELNTSPDAGLGANVLPQVATDRNGRWVASWMTCDGSGADCTVRIARSSNNGTTWSAPASIGNASTLDRDPRIVTDGSGHWVLVWSSDDSLAGTLGSDSDILVARSTDDGATWTAPAPLNGNAATDSGTDDGPQLAVDGAGHWVAVWRSTDTLGGTIGDDSDILVARSTDHGATWTYPVPLNGNAATDPVEPSPHPENDLTPQIATDGRGNWVAIWYSSGSLSSPFGTDGDVLMARSVDHGATWSAPAPVNSDAATDPPSKSDRDPHIGVNRTGTWIAVWKSSGSAESPTGSDPDVIAASAQCALPLAPPTSTPSPTISASATHTQTATPPPPPTVPPTATSTAPIPPTPTPTPRPTDSTTATRTSSPTPPSTLTVTPSATPTRTVATQTATRTSTRTAAPTQTGVPTLGPAVRLDPIAAPIVIGAANQLSGSGFTAGSRIMVFVAAASTQAHGPFTPSAITPTALTWLMPATIPLGAGFCAVVVVNTDQNFIQSNARGQLLLGAAAANIPTILSINGVGLHAVDETVPLAYVETFVVPGATITIGGTGFNRPLVNFYTANGNLGPLAPLPGGNASGFQITAPTNAPVGPGNLQVVNHPYIGNVQSNAVSVPIGALVTITSISQTGSTVTVTGTGFSTASVINLFNVRPGGVANLGGFGPNGPNTPLTVVSSTQFTFTVPAGAVTGPAYVQVINPPYILYSSSGSDPDGIFTITAPSGAAGLPTATPTPTPPSSP